MQSDLAILPCRVHDVARGTGTDVYRCLSMFPSLRLSLHLFPKTREHPYAYCLGVVAMTQAPTLIGQGCMLMMHHTGARFVPSDYGSDFRPC